MKSSIHYVPSAIQTFLFAVFGVFSAFAKSYTIQGKVIDASTKSPLTDREEAKNFAKDEYFNLYITLRGCDERAKEEQGPLPNLEKYRDMMINHLVKN